MSGGHTNFYTLPFDCMVPFRPGLAANMPAHSTRLPMLGLQQLASVQARAHRANTMSEHIFNVFMLSQFLISNNIFLGKGPAAAVYCAFLQLLAEA